MRCIDFDDELYRTYAAGRRMSPDVLEMWMAAIAQLMRNRTVVRALDLGAGTGRFTAPLAARLGARVFALDPSRRMLAELGAEAPSVVGRAESLPFPEGAFDLVFASMVIHHFGDLARAAAEVARVLSPRGCFVVRTCFADRLVVPYHRWFPSVLAIEQAMLPTEADFEEALAAVGLRRDGGRRLRQRMDSSLRAYAERMRLRAMSPLRMISDEEFAAGMAELDAEAEREQEPVDLYEEIDLLRFCHVAPRASSSTTGTS